MSSGSKLADPVGGENAYHLCLSTDLFMNFLWINFELFKLTVSDNFLY